MEYKAIRVIISGGVTGGHIFPAVSIAHKLKQLNPATEILFVGAEGKMEMEKVPAEGFRIVGLPMVGMQRQLSARNLLNNLTVPFRVLDSIRRARNVFGMEQVVIVTQEYHLFRALFLAEAYGLEASGVSATLRTYGPKQVQWSLREVLARDKDFARMVFGEAY